MYECTHVTCWYCRIAVMEKKEEKEEEHKDTQWERKDKQWSDNNRLRRIDLFSVNRILLERKIQRAMDTNLL